MNKILHLNLEKQWFEQVKSGEKKVELRKVCDYWRKRLVGKIYDEIHIKCGYPRKNDNQRIIKRKWTCIAKETVLHPKFGDKPVEVFVIDISKKI